MQYSEGKIGRVFVLRLEDNEPVVHTIETFAKEKNILVGHVALIGCIKDGTINSGPVNQEDDQPIPISIELGKASETLSTGVIAPDINNHPILHLHGAMGRDGNTNVGCIMKSVNAWLVNEVIIYEIICDDIVNRIRNEKSGFTLLNIEKK